MGVRDDYLVRDLRRGLTLLLAHPEQRPKTVCPHWLTARKVMLLGRLQMSILRPCSEEQPLFPRQPGPRVMPDVTGRTIMAAVDTVTRHISDC